MMTLTPETPMEAARRLAARQVRKGFQFEALHEYTAPLANPLHWRIRLKHPETGDKWIRPMKLNGEGYALGEPDYPDGKPLYRLHDLAGRPVDPVIVVEGEWCVDALGNISVLATTSGAADSADKADWGPLAGRSVTIWPDNDEAGRRYADAVATKLLVLGCAVRMVDVAALNLTLKGDAVDWLDANPNTTAADIAALSTGDLLESALGSTWGLADTTGAATPEAALSLNSKGLHDEVNRLAAMRPLEYERVREAKAKELGVRRQVLDDEVNAARGSRTEEGGKAVKFKAVEPWHKPVQGAALLDEILAVIQRFIVCERETAITATLWCAFTWFIDHVQVAPLAVITAPEKRCGKSQLLDLIGRLSRRPLRASNISPAAVYRVVETHSPTLLIDEADSFFQKHEDLRGIINSGHTRQSAYVIRTVGDDHEAQQFSTWGAKAISGIGQLAETLMDRAVVLELRRRLPSEAVQRLRHAEPGLFDRLASKLARFAEDAGAAIERARPELPETLNDRAQDNWEPLLAIADHAGGQWPEAARLAACMLSGSEQKSVSLSAELLEDIREVFEHKGVDRLSTADLLQALNKDDLKPWSTYSRSQPMTPRQLAKRLNGFGIQPRTIRKGSSTVKGFMRIWFEDAFSRYLPSPATPTNPVTPSQMSSKPRHTGVAPVTEGEPCDVTLAQSVTRNSAPDLDCYGVTDPTLTSGEEMVEVEV